MIKTLTVYSTGTKKKNVFRITFKRSSVLAALISKVLYFPKSENTPGTSRSRWSAAAEVAGWYQAFTRDTRKHVPKPETGS